MSTELVRFIKQFDFEGHGLTLLTFKGRGCLLASQVGGGLGYAEGSLSDQICGAWKGEFKEGLHFDVLRGEELQQFKEFLSASVGEEDPEFKSVSFSARTLLLYEPGLHKILLKTRKKAGVLLREKLAVEILPEIARTGSYQGAASLPEATDSLDLVIQQSQQIVAVAQRMKDHDRRLGSVESEVAVVKGELARLQARPQALGLPPATVRALLNRHIRDWVSNFLASRLSKLDGGYTIRFEREISDCWHTLDKAVYDRCRIDLPARAKNAGLKRLPAAEQIDIPDDPPGLPKGKIIDLYYLAALEMFPAPPTK